MIRVQGLWAGYRAGFSRAWRDVLRGVSFEVPRGAVAGYLGVNGAGKTTTIKVLVGVNPARQGVVEIDGAPAGTRAAQSRLGYFPEAPFFYDGLTARELLAFYGRLSGLDHAAIAARSPALLEQVGLAQAADQPVRGYSKGMRQRLGLAQALVADPSLLVLDEPLDGLDPMGRLELRELILRQAKAGKTVFFSSHVLGDVEAICDHLVVLDGGTIAHQGPPAGLLGDQPPSIDLELGGLSPAAVEAVGAAAGSPVEVRGGGRWAVSCQDAVTADRVVDAARAAGGRVVRLAERRPGLEELFLARFRPGAKAAP